MEGRKEDRERGDQVGEDGGAEGRESGRKLGRTDDTEQTLKSTQWLHRSLHSHLLHCWQATQEVPWQLTQLVGVELAAAERGVLWDDGPSVYPHTICVCTHMHAQCIHTHNMHAHVLGSWNTPDIIY